MIAKVAGGIVGLGLISAGGIAMAKPHWLGMDYMPKWHSLSEDSEFSGSSSAYTEGKFGKKYGKYLVGVSNVENEGWWKWALRRLNNENTKPAKFADVDKGYFSGNDDKALNKVCKKAYETEISNGFDAGADGVNFKKSDVWKYCSPGLLTHTKEDDYDSKTIGGNESNKTVLVSVKDSANDWFWEIRNKDFWSSEESSELSGKKATGENDKKSIFKTEYETNSKSGKEKERKTIKKLCEEAYIKDKVSEVDDKNNDDAKKFCVLETA